MSQQYYKLGTNMCKHTFLIKELNIPLCEKSHISLTRYLQTTNVVVSYKTLIVNNSIHLYKTLMSFLDQKFDNTKITTIIYIATLIY